MIAVNELRIGNWILGEDYCEMKVNWVAVKSLSEGLAVFEPIPLTSEILEKLGFHQCDDGYGTYSINGKEGNSIRIRSESLILVNVNADEGGFAIKRPDYLHQLQNLYFDVTGEELEVDL